MASPRSGRGILRGWGAQDLPLIQDAYKVRDLLRGTTDWVSYHLWQMGAPKPALLAESEAKVPLAGDAGFQKHC